jgi:hypothetical protein
MSAESATTTPAKTAKRSVQISAMNWRYIAYFFGVPMTVAIYAGLNNWEMQNIAGLTPSLFFYLAHSMLPWWITCTLTTTTKLSLARWKPPWLIILLVGHTLGCIVVTFFSNWLTGIYEAAWPELEITGHIVPLMSAEFWVYWARAGVIWVGINFLFDRFFGLPLYRYVIPRGYEVKNGSGASHSSTAENWNNHPPGFIDRLPVSLHPNEVLAIKAEQHYIKVYTPQKDYMVLYRFSDAIRELDQALGLQVHRSFWVNTSAIESVQAKAKDFRIKLKTGAEIPVSGPYQGLVREHARTQRLSLRG